MNMLDILIPLALASLSMVSYFLKDAHTQLREAFRRVDALQIALTTSNLNMATDFVRKSELHEIEIQLDKVSEAIFGKIDRLSERVDDKFAQLTQRLDSRIENVATKFDTQIESLGKDLYRQVHLKQDKP